MTEHENITKTAQKNREKTKTDKTKVWLEGFSFCSFKFAYVPPMLKQL